MNDRFVHYFRIVAAIHVGVILLFAVLSACGIFFRKRRDVAVPVEFVVEIPPVLQAREEIPAAAVEQIPVDAPVPRPEPKPERKPIKRSYRRISRKNVSSSTRKSISSDEIKRLLAQGAKPGDYTSIPDDDTRCLEIVRQVLFRAWRQPGAEEIGYHVPEIRIWLDSDGRILKWKLVTESESPVHDASVIEAVSSVRRIDGLSTAFLERNRSILVSFKVE